MTLRNKKGQGFLKSPVLLVVILLVAAAWLGKPGAAPSAPSASSLFGTAPAPAAGTAEPSAPPVVGITGFTGTPTVAWDAERKYTGASVTGGTVYYWLNGVYQPTATLGSGTTNVAAGDVIDSYVTNTSYYGEYIPAVTMNQVANNKIHAVLALQATASSMSSFIKDPDGTLNSDNTTEYDVSAGGVYTFEHTVIGHYQRDYGNAYVGNPAKVRAGFPTAKNVYVVEANISQIDTVTLTYTQKGKTFTAATTSKPDQLSVGSTNTTWSFLVDPIESNEEVKYLVVVDVDDTNPPASVNLDSSGIDIFDAEYYLNTVIATNLEQGVENDQNSNVGISTHLTDTIYMD